MIRLYDTATRQVRELALRDPGTVSLYVCGPTVYDLPHLGHGRQLLTYDILRRYLEWTGLDVRHVSNVTDIDDNIINRAAELGEDSGEVARRYEGEWWSAVDKLGVLRPTAVPHATEFVPQMVALVEELLRRGVAYETSDGVYLSVQDVDGYGLLAQQDLDKLQATERVDDERTEEKRSPLDFVLWKKSKPGEPTWESPWGAGRPGWNTECVVMSLELLGEGFDLHSGGMDLKFPHHENERAQAVALHTEFARHWMHHAFVVDSEGEKMSKSLGNFSTLTDMLERVDPRAYRLVLLQAHYRAPISVDADRIAAAEAALAGFDRLVVRLEEAGAATNAVDPDDERIAAWREAMDDDLHTERAMAEVFDWVRQANSALDRGDLDAAASLGSLVVTATAAVGLDIGGRGTEIDPAALELAASRDAARAERNFAEADRLRDEIRARFGYVVEDTPAGTKLRAP